MVEWNYQQENEHGTEIWGKVGPQAKKVRADFWKDMLLALIRDRCLNSNYRKLR